MIGEAVTTIVGTGVFAIASSVELDDVLDETVGSATATAGSNAQRLTLARARILRDIWLSEEMRPVDLAARD
jgi:hypothetical protein